MAEYIDRDELLKELCTVSAPTPSESWIVEKCIEKVNEQPDADVVEVVRCKDCERAEMYNFYDEDVPRLACVEKKNGEVCFATKVEPNHFCSYGERKEQT